MKRRKIALIFILMASIIAVTAFRRGDRRAWWALLVSNTIALVSALRYDWTVNAIGPFELTEYLGLVMIYAALAITAPFHASGRPVRATSQWNRFTLPIDSYCFFALQYNALAC